MGPHFGHVWLKAAIRRAMYGYELERAPNPTEPHQPPKGVFPTLGRNHGYDVPTMCAVNAQYMYMYRHACHHTGSCVMGDRLFLGYLRYLDHTHIHAQGRWVRGRGGTDSGQSLGWKGSMHRWVDCCLACSMHDFMRPAHVHTWP